MRVVKTLLLLVGLGYLGATSVELVHQLGDGSVTFHVSVPWLLASAAFVGAAFLVLIWAWLDLITGLTNRRIPYLTGARIWFISNLSIYIPAGPGWQIMQMGVMSTEQGIGGVAAGSAAVINAAINIGTGLAVAAVAGAPLMARYFGSTWLAWSVGAVGVAGIASLPVLLPKMLAFGHARFARTIPGDAPRAHVIARVAAANVLSWILYGLALQCLSAGLLDAAPGTMWQYTASFAVAYAAGYLFFLSPGGIVVRERVLTSLLVTSQLATTSEATGLVIGSRLFLIAMQVIPALVFLAYRRRSPDETIPAR